MYGGNGKTHMVQNNNFNNEKDRQLARILSTIFVGSEVLYLIAIAIGLFVHDLKMVAITLAGFLLLIVPMVLLKRHNLRGSIFTFVIFSLVTVSGVATVGQGIRDTAVMAFPVIVLFAGLTLDKRFFRICVGLTLAAMGWLPLGEVNGWFVTKPFDGAMESWILFIFAGGILLIAAFAVELLTKNMRNNLIRAESEIVRRKALEESQRKYEQQLQQTQKLESLGILAGGIAHDFNNLLGGVYLYIDLAAGEIKDKIILEYLSNATSTIERARALTLQLLTFAKGGVPIKKVEHLFPFVQETAQFALSGSNVLCNFEIQQDLPTCDFDKNQISQVIDNIVINAKQAMPDGGAILLTAENIKVAQNDHPQLTGGDYIRISIKDSGVGMPKEILPRIFDPFYTTKTTGHGLGLASCYSIVKRHGGSIDVESEPGKGSTFHIFLPASKEIVSSSPEKFASVHKGRGTFLVMDDEEVILNTFRTILEKFGYEVICKKNGKEAIDFVSSEIDAKREIRGMIFDLTIPGGMGGREAIDEIRKMNFKNPAFVTSGYAEDPVMANPEEYGFTSSLSKPFRKSELSELLNKYIKP